MQLPLSTCMLRLILCIMAWMSTNKNFSWEIVSTAGFELDILRGKQPYKWTIWRQLYLGTRYTTLLDFAVFLVHMDGGKIPCLQLWIVDFALAYIGWAFASLIIVLRSRYGITTFLCLYSLLVCVRFVLSSVRSMFSFTVPASTKA
ncbi:hypothetical protein BGW80DRAFT_1547227 [Lactifluus volemus]|nr:hypothetical protein BGW80DRAFT_1547227 [Lactifluus volemus]